jgi:dTDP-4-dehydrorhamnose 3,5-epimerase
MIFQETGLEGAFVVRPEPVEDARGFFARSWCKREAEAVGITVDWVQSNVSLNRRRGTLRGMHYQYPRWEAKLVRVTHGSIFDVMVDLRPSSPTYRRCFTDVLSASNRTMFFIPRGFAHGFMSLEDDTEILYQMSEYYDPEQGKGFRWDDPQFAIPWPPGEKILSERDRNLPLFTPP